MSSDIHWCCFLPTPPSLFLAPIRVWNMVSTVITRHGIRFLQLQPTRTQKVGIKCLKEVPLFTPRDWHSLDFLSVWAFCTTLSRPVICCFQLDRHVTRAVPQEANWWHKVWSKAQQVEGNTEVMPLWETHSPAQTQRMDLETRGAVGSEALMTVLHNRMSGGQAYPEAVHGASYP